MGKAQFAGEIAVGNLVLKGKLYPVSKSEVSQMTKRVHEVNGAIHTLSPETRQRCPTCKVIVPDEKVRSAVPIDGELVILAPEDISEAAGDKALIFTERLEIAELHLPKMEKSYWFVPIPGHEKLADALYALIVRDGLTFGGDLVVSGVTRKSYLFPWQQRLYLVRFLYGEETHEKPEGSERSSFPPKNFDEGVSRIRAIIGTVPSARHQEVIATNPRRLALRDRAKMVLIKS